MELTTQQQTYAFLWSMVLGVVIEVLYVIMMAVRCASPPGKVSVFVSDMLFSVIVCLLNFMLAVSRTEGKIRLYALVGQLIAFSLLYLTIGRRGIRLLGRLFSRGRNLYHRINDSFEKTCGQMIRRALPIKMSNLQKKFKN